MYKTIYLKQGKDESLRRYHPWVFSGAIERMDSDVAEGDTVRVVTHSGAFIAIGHYQQGSIAVRVLSFSDVEINEAFWLQRLTAAYNKRQCIGLTPTDTNPSCYRLVHGEGDSLPGLVIDCYGATAVMQAHSSGMHLARHLIASAIIQATTTVKHVYYKSETTLNSSGMNGFLVGGCQDDIAEENHLRFHVDWL